MTQEFDFPSRELDSLRNSFGEMDEWPSGSGDFPGFFFSDTLTLGENFSMDGLQMDMQGLMDELTKSLESMDPSYLEGMEELLEHFKSNGIVPDEDFKEANPKGKKKKKIYKI